MLFAVLCYLAALAAVSSYSFTNPGSSQSIAEALRRNKFLLGPNHAVSFCVLMWIIKVIVVPFFHFPLISVVDL